MNLVFSGPPVLTVKIMNNTESSCITVQWDEVDASLTTTYIVTWSSERDHITHPVTLTEQSSYTITGLTLDTVYTITVTAANRCGTGPEYSTSVSLTTDASTNTLTMLVASPSSITASIVQHVPTASIIVMNPNTTTTSPITTTVSIITNITGMITVTETTKLKTTIVSMNPIDVTGMISVTKTTKLKTPTVSTNPSDVTGMITVTESTEHKTTIVSTNPSAVITTSLTSHNTSTSINIGIVMSSTSTVYIADTTAGDETSKFVTVKI